MMEYIKIVLYCVTVSLNHGYIWTIVNKCQINCLRVFLEHTIMLLPFLLSTTSLITNGLLITIPVSLAVLVNLVLWSRKLKINKESVITSRRRVRDLLIHRGTVYIITSICILAIDLPTFRHELKKSKYIGVGLMDLGIGLFVMHMGVKGYGERWAQSSYCEKKTILLRIIRTSGLLIVMGVFRYVLINFFDFSYSPIEYGRDSNVFFVLAAVKFIGSLGDIALHGNISPFKVAIPLIIGYEIWLIGQLYDYSSFNDYDYRRDFNIFVANIESFVSLIGFAGLFLLARQIGICFFDRAGSNDRIQSSIKMLKYSLVISLTNAFLVYQLMLVRESRRLCNAAYTMWTVSIFLLNSGIFRIFEANYHQDTPHYTEKIDQIGITYFICGNISVGIFRLLIRHVSVPFWSSVPILYVHCSVIYFLAYHINKVMTLLGISSS